MAPGIVWWHATQDGNETRACEFVTVALRCEHGCMHERAACETAGCTRCDSDSRSCDVATFVAANRADCDRTFAARDTSFLSGATSGAAAALVHLREAWCDADQTDRPSIERAIRVVLNAQSMREGTPLFHELLVQSLDDEQAKKLLEAVGVGAGKGTAPTHINGPQVAVTITVSPIVAELMAVVDGGNVDDPFEWQVARVLRRLVDHAQRGVCCPGAWERGWLVQAVGDRFLTRLVRGDPYGRYPECTLDEDCHCRGCAIYERPAWAD